MKDYEINDSTLAILPTESLNSTILEENYRYEVERHPLSILNYSCNYFGSSYSGRKEGSRMILNSGYKLPILVEDSQNIIFFPTISPDADDCVWLALNKIVNYEAGTDPRHETVVEFINGQKIILNVSMQSFKNQLLRASRLESVLRNRKQERII